jgi:hypothetical protein
VKAGVATCASYFVLRSAKSSSVGFGIQSLRLRADGLSVVESR